MPPPTSSPASPCLQPGLCTRVTTVMGTALRSLWTRVPRPRPEDFPAGSMWFAPEAHTLFFVKNIRLGRSHPGVVRIARINGRDHITPACHRDMAALRITRVQDVPEPLQSVAVRRIILSLLHDLHDMQAPTPSSAFGPSDLPPTQP